MVQAPPAAMTMHSMLAVFPSQRSKKPRQQGRQAPAPTAALQLGQRGRPASTYYSILYYTTHHTRTHTRTLHTRHASPRTHTTHTSHSHTHTTHTQTAHAHDPPHTDTQHSRYTKGPPIQQSYQCPQDTHGTVGPALFGRARPAICQGCNS